MLSVPAVVQAEPLTRQAFASFGQVIEEPVEAKGLDANQGTAKRYNQVAQLINLRTGTAWMPAATLNSCIYRCAPTPTLPFVVKLLERHPYSSQAFIPMPTPPHDARHAYL